MNIMSITIVTSFAIAAVLFFTGMFWISEVVFAVTNECGING